MGSFIVALVFAVLSAVLISLGSTGPTDCTDNPFAMCGLEGNSCDKVDKAWRCLLFTADPCSGASTIHMQNLTRTANPKSSTVDKCFMDWFKHHYYLKQNTFCRDSRKLSESCIDEHEEVGCGYLVLSFAKSAEYIHEALRCEGPMLTGGGISISSTSLFFVGIFLVLFKNLTV